MAAAMVLPKLYANSNHITVSTTAKILKKYRHLIDWKDEPSILEFGFADGGNSERSLRPLLPADYKEFLGVDISEPMVEYAKKHSAMPRSEFVQLDIATGNLPDRFRNRFDHVFSFYTLKMNVARQAFKNTYATLKPQGETFQVFFKVLPVEDAFDALARHPKWGKYGHEMMVTTSADSKPREFFENAVKEAGFNDVVMEDEDVTYKFANEQAWKDLYYAVNPVVANIPPNQIEEYKEDYFSEIRKHTLKHTDDCKDQEVKVDYTLFVVAAKKK